MIVPSTLSASNVSLSETTDIRKTSGDVLTFSRRFIAELIGSIMDIIGKKDNRKASICSHDNRKASTCSHNNRKASICRLAPSCTLITRSVNYFGAQWPTCAGISVRSGMRFIDREMEIWNLLPELKHWMHHIEFIGLSRKSGSDVYTYEILWSIPTPAYPEPQVTASVFFFLKAGTPHLPNTPIEISYVFEGSQFRHGLDMSFQPKWLYDVLDMKTMIFKTLKF